MIILRHIIQLTRPLARKQKGKMLKTEPIIKIDFYPELKFTASRSGGKGGQHVNKVSTKVELHFDYMHSTLINDEQKGQIGLKLAAYINSAGILKVSASEDRSQWLNRKIAIQKFYSLLQKAFSRPKKRVPTKPGAASRRKRRDWKKKQSFKKELRKKYGKKDDF